MSTPAPEIRFYHFKRSAFLLEIAADYVRVVPLDGGRTLFSEKPSIVRMWDRMAHEGLRIDVYEHDQLELSAKPYITQNDGRCTAL